MTKGLLVTYRSGSGFLYTAVILRAHRSGDFTIRVQFPIRDGRICHGAFQGDRFRVPARMISAA